MKDESPSLYREKQMLVIGSWLALFFYIISWVSGLFAAVENENSSAEIKSGIEEMGMRLGWGLHTISLLGLLWVDAVWPSTFVSDLLSATAWATMIAVQAFPEKLPSLVNSYIVRVFGILLLGLSLIISEGQVQETEIVSEQSWLYHTLLGTHIISFIAGYVLFSVACFASIIFLYQEHQLKTKIVNSMMMKFPALGTLDRLSWKGTLWGFLALSVGIMLGIIINADDQSTLANLRFGLSVSAWCVYAMVLLIRQLQTVRTRLTAIWPILGFGLALLALFVEIYRLNLSV